MFDETRMQEQEDLVAKYTFCSGHLSFWRRSYGHKHSVHLQLWT